MGSRKISFHTSGCRIYAFLNDNIANAARQQSNFPGSTRRIYEWRQPSREVAPGIVHELNIIIPTDDLLTENLWPNDKEICPILPASAGMATEIDICMPSKAGSTAHLPGSRQVGPGRVSYQYTPIEGGPKDSIEEFRKMIAACVRSKAIDSPESYRVISEPVALKEHIEGGGPRVIYELSVKQTLACPA